MMVNGVKGRAQIQWDQDGGFTMIGRLPDVVESEQWGSFCWVALAVCLTGEDWTKEKMWWMAGNDNRKRRSRILEILWDLKLDVS